MRGVTLGSGYAGNHFHRIVPGFMCEAGDIKASHGAQSIYGRLFADEQHAPSRPRLGRAHAAAKANQ